MTIEITPVGTYQTGIFDQSGAEIPAYDPSTKRLFVVNANQVSVEVLDLSDPNNPTKITEIDASNFGGVANSVDVKNGLVVVAIEDVDKEKPGKIAFFDSTATDFSTPLNILSVGSLPDMVTFTPDGNKVLVANEGEPNETYTVDPEGSISIVDISNGVEALKDTDVMTADFQAFNDQEEALKLQGVRIFGPGASVAQDLEPEYIALSSDSQTAYVSLQENNAIAVVDVKNSIVLDILPLGFKDYTIDKLDASDDDDQINITNWPVFGMYQPDSIDVFTVNGENYLITANEGDSRVYPTVDLPDGLEEGDVFNEESRVSDLILDPDAFPDAAELQKDENLGRLTVTNTLGDTDEDGDFDKLYSFGGRSFSIWDTQGNLVFDSGDRFEQDVAAAIPEFFNSNSDDNDSFDNRSDNKGPEPEGVVIGEVNEQIYAFIGLERVGGVMVYNVTNPLNPEFVQYVNNRNFVDENGEFIDTQLEDGSTNPAAGDLAPEGLTFISEEDSPNGQPLLVVANEVSGSTTIYAVNQPEIPLPEVIFGTSEADMFDSALSTKKGFSGDRQILFTGSGSDIVDTTTAQGNNRIKLGSGNDLFYGGTGDRVLAGSGSDVLFIGESQGRNVITGGKGADQFWLATDSVDLPSFANRITDFTIGKDVIGFAATDLSFDDLNLMQDGSRTIIQGLGKNLAILLNTQSSDLSASDFVFA